MRRLTGDVCCLRLLPVQIESIRHKALRNFAETGKPKGLDAQLVDRLRKMIAFLAAIDGPEELLTPPNWGGMRSPATGLAPGR